MNTVDIVNAKDYTGEQLNVWATGQVDLEKWNLSLQEHYSGPMSILWTKKVERLCYSF